MIGNEAVKVIEDILGATVVDSLIDGLPDGKHREWGYDPQLILEISEACRRWEKRALDLEG